MDYNEYNDIQLQLGGVGDELRLNMKEMLDSSEADPAAKALVQNATEQIAKSLNALSILISRSLRLIGK